MKKLMFIIISMVVIFFTLNLFININKSTKLQNRIHAYLSDKQNRIKTFQDAIALNNNETSNTCVYFVAEVLRNTGIPIEKRIANTSELISVLDSLGWEKHTDYKKLKSGDLVFTTDGFGNKQGAPSHAYIFMDWVKKGDYEYAYICDNQAKDYDNKIYHIRNIKNVDKSNGSSKDAFNFFMKL